MCFGREDVGVTLIMIQQGVVFGCKAGRCMVDGWWLMVNMMR